MKTSGERKVVAQQQPSVVSPKNAKTSSNTKLAVKQPYEFTMNHQSEMNTNSVKSQNTKTFAFAQRQRMQCLSVSPNRLGASNKGPGGPTVLSNKASVNPALRQEYEN